MPTLLSIVNSALIKLGAMPVIDINNGTKESDLIGLSYETHRDYVLSQHGWKCAIKRVALTATTITPISGNTQNSWQYAVQLPSDFIRQVRNDDSKMMYELEGNQILTNCGPSIMLRYIYRVEDPTLFTPDFAETISYYMAQDVALSLTGDPRIADRLTKQYATFESKAKFRDSATSKAPQQDDNLFVYARLNGNHL